jgi:hypothetical protein
MLLENDCKKNGGVFQRVLYKKVDHPKDYLRIHRQSGVMFVKSRLLRPLTVTVSKERS